MVVTANPHATRAAFEILEKKGNAVDAAIAAQWVLNVVEPQSSGIGGGGFFLYYEAATKRIYAFDGRETAPAEAFPEMFLDEKGEPLPFKPDRITGGLPVGVPGTLALLKEVHDQFASKRFTFSQLFDPAIDLAERGFPISERLAFFIDQEKSRLALFDESGKYFLLPDGSPKPKDEILTQPDLAKTFRLIQEKGTEIFYQGEIADAVVSAVRNAPFHPGFMKKEDLTDYRIAERMSVRGSYRGYDIFSMSPPSSGGTTLIEALHILENYDLRLLGRKSDGMHVFLEAQKLAFEDRNRLLGDPDFVEIPVEELISKAFAEKKTQAIRFEAAAPTQKSGVRTLMLEAPNTTHISIADSWGNMAAFTSTIEEIFGSAMMVPGYGFFLNNELTDFDALPKDENGKLVPNAAEGQKRPRSSMTPTFVFKEGKPALIAGTPGGATIIGTVLNLIVNLLDFQMSAEEAIRSPRLIHRGEGAELEPPLFKDEQIRRELERRGHGVQEKEVIGNVQMIYFEEGGKIMIGSSDPRGEGEAMGL